MSGRTIVMVEKIGVIAGIVIKTLPQTFYGQVEFRNYGRQFWLCGNAARLLQNRVRHEFRTNLAISSAAKACVALEGTRIFRIVTRESTHFVGCATELGYVSLPAVKAYTCIEKSFKWRYTGRYIQCYEAEMCEQILILHANFAAYQSTIWLTVCTEVWRVRRASSWNSIA